jgi:hypothetical protein
MSQQMIDDIFNRVTFDEVDRALHYALYESVKDIASVMDVNAPESAEKTLAFRALHLALMHYGSALAKKYPKA